MSEEKITKVRIFPEANSDTAYVRLEQRNFTNGRNDVSFQLMRHDGNKYSNICNLFIDDNGKLSLELDYCNGDLCNVDEKHRIKVVKLDD